MTLKPQEVSPLEPLQIDILVDEWRKIIDQTKKQLMIPYGKGFSEKSLHRTIRCGELFPGEQFSYVGSIVLILKKIIPSYSSGSKPGGYAFKTTLNYG